MNLELPCTCDLPLPQRVAAYRRFARAMASGFMLLAAWLLLPDAAWAQAGSSGGLDFQLGQLDAVFCGFITFSKTKLAPYIAVVVIMVGVIGHWLGATKMWGTLLYVAIGLGVILGIGSTIAKMTGSAASCIAQ